jgi:hypothetical protein
MFAFKELSVKRDKKALNQFWKSDEKNLGGWAWEKKFNEIISWLN